eukprot:m.24678 g.24678  ORF g.24678 m.24678 type:complete len:682 (-) comp4179_c0_seq1:124-2169(-)
MAATSPPDQRARVGASENARRTLSPASNSQIVAGRTPGRSRMERQPSNIGVILEGEQTINHYTLGKTVGKGNFAKVKIAHHTLTGAEVAIKIVDKTSLNESSMAKLKREVDIMKQMDHPNIVKLYQVIDTDTTLYLVMEYAAGGEVFDYLVDHGRMQEKDARLKFRQIVSAVEYCHARGVIHRDLKAENLLLDADMNIKIADFGFSNTFKPGDQLDTFCGSPPYAAPELFRGLKYNGPEVDVWSLGVILYTLVSGSLPFDGQSLKELRDRVLRGKYRIPFYMSQECEKLLKQFLAVSPQKRTSLRDVMDHEWMNMQCEPLVPYVNQPQGPVDMPRVQHLVQMGVPGLTEERILKSIDTMAFDHQHASYTLLGITGWRATPPAQPKPTAERPGLPRRSSLATMTTSDGIKTTGPVRPVTTDPSYATTEDEVFDEALERPSEAPERIQRDVTRVTRSQTETPGTPARRTTVSTSGQVPATGPRVMRPRQDAAAMSLRRRSTSPNDAARAAQPAMSHGLRDSSGPNGAITPPSSDELDNGSGTPKRGSGILKGVQSLRRRFSRGQEDTVASPPSKAQPRVLRFHFSRANTSARNPNDIMHELQRVLQRNGIKFVKTEAYTLACQHEKKLQHEKLQFEVEVCKMPRLSMHGIRHRRIQGDSLAYRNVLTQLLQEMASFLEGADAS